MGSTFTHMFYPGTVPFEFEESQFDPMFGFEETGRKVREPNATVQEMASHNIILNRRDFCGKELMEYEKCKHDYFPFYLNCTHELHAYGWCQYDDYVIRMKEYEREKRLMARAKRVGPENAGYKVAPTSS